MADGAQDDGDEDAVGGAEEEGDVGGEEAGEEACCRESCGEHVEGDGDGEVGRGENSDVV